MFSKINTILVTIDAYVWGIPLIVLILSVGLFLTIRLKGVQFTIIWVVRQTISIIMDTSRQSRNSWD